jgi:hypothetical protein
MTEPFFAGKATLTGSKGQDLNLPKKAIVALRLAKGDVLLVWVEGRRIVMRPASPSRSGRGKS